MKKVSIIIPVYNTEAYLADCLTSICQQTYRALEIIVVDDGSSDESRACVQAFQEKDERIQLHILPRSQGVGAARNYGMDVATGEYLYFADSDDYIPERTIQMLVENIKGADFIRGKLHYTHFSTMEALIIEGALSPKVMAENRYNLLKSASALNILFRRSYIKEQGVRFSTKVDLYCDLPFVVPLFVDTPEVLFLKQAVYFIRRRTRPIQAPSLNQEPLPKRLEQFVEVYTELKELSEDEYLQDYLDKTLLNLYRNQAIKYMNQTGSVSEVYRILRPAMVLIRPEFLKMLGPVFRHEVQVFRKGNEQRFALMYKRYVFMRELKDTKGSVQKFKVFIYHHFFMKLPVKQHLVFYESFLG